LHGVGCTSHIVGCTVAWCGLYVACRAAVPLHGVGCTSHAVRLYDCMVWAVPSHAVRRAVLFAAVLADGRPTGEAFVMFASAADAKLACIKDR
jgi:hypothetical protein